MWGNGTTPYSSAQFYFFNFDSGGLGAIDNKKYAKRSINLQEAMKYFGETFKNCGQIIIDDMAADAEIVRKRSALSELVISGRHTGRSL